MILCVGECMVELAPAGDGLFRQGFAGDTFNTAWYLRRLGQAVGYFTCLGQDPMSDRMIAFFEAEGIDARTIARIPDRAPGLYMISLDRGERSFSYWRDRAAARLLARDEVRLRAAVATAEVVVFSGITLAVQETDADRDLFLAALADHRAAGLGVVFDPNLRERLWGDAETMRQFVTRAAAVSSIVLPSFDEDRAAFGDGTPAATIARYRKAGAGTVVVKNGTAPVEAWSTDGGSARHAPIPVEPVDTTAAGDSFNAGFLNARLRGADLAGALRAGAELSARVVTARGALVPRAVR